MQQAFAVVELYGLFAIWSLALFMLLPSTKQDLREDSAVGVAALIIGPVMLGVFLWAGMWALPGRSTDFWLLVVWLLPLLPIVARYRSFLSRLSRALSAAKEMPGKPVTLFLCALFLLASLFGPLLLLPQLLLLPVQGNDPLEYMQLGRAIFDLRDTSVYPFLDAELTGGFVSPWTHPPTYGVLIALAYMLQDGSEVAGAAKFIALWFGVALAVLCAVQVYLLERRFTWRAIVAPFLLFTIPLFFQLVQSSHIDGMRIAAFTVGTLAVSWALTQGTTRMVSLAGLGLAAALCTHSIGFLAPILSAAVIVFVWQRGGQAFVRFALLAGVVAASIGLPHYIRNVFIFGNPIQDNVPVWQLPELRIVEFLQTTRGLETLPDRFWHGVLMPVSRTQEFGFLGILLAGLLLWALLGRQLQGRAIQLWRARQDLPLLHIALFVSSFVLLMVASVLAGSELAVKNARYLLTIMPLCVVLLLAMAGRMSFAGQTGERPMDWTLRAPFRWVGRWLPRTLTAQLTAAGDPSPATGPIKTSLHIRLFTFMLLVSLLAAAMHQVYLAVRVSYSVVALYVGHGGVGISWNRLGESELLKWEGSSLPEAILESETRRIVPANERVLVFRQASFGFYKVANFRFYIDRDLVHLFQHKETVSLWRDLRESGFGWITVPEYPIAEIQNSAFSALLRDPSFVLPARKVGGWTLYQLRSHIESAGVRVLQQSGQDILKAIATTEEGSGEVDGSRARIEVDQTNGFVEFVREPGVVKRLNRWDAVLFRPVKTGIDPDTANAVDFRFPQSGYVLLEATLSGQGLAEVAIEYTYNDVLGADLTDQQLFPVAGEMGSMGKRHVVRESVWTGTLDERATKVGGWLLPIPSIGSSERDRAARIVFRLRDGRSLRIHEWSASAVRLGSEPTLSQELDLITKAGWRIATANGLRSVAIRVNETDSSAEMLRSGRFTVVRASTAPLQISPPAQEFASTSETNSATLDESIRLLEAGNLALHVDAELRGRGELAPSVVVLCKREARAAPENYTLSVDTMSLANSPTQRTFFRENLQPVFLMDGERDVQQWSIRVPCLPAAARLVVESRFSRVEIPERYMASPDSSRRGEVGIASLTMRVGAGEAGEYAVSQDILSQ